RHRRARSRGTPACHHRRSSPKLGGRGGLLARLLSVAFSSRDAARRRPVRAARLYRERAATPDHPSRRRRARDRATAGLSLDCVLVPAPRRMISRDRLTALGPMPGNRRMTTVDERLVRAPLDRAFAIAADVERWPTHL